MDLTRLLLVVFVIMVVLVEFSLCVNLYVAMSTISIICNQVNLRRLRVLGRGRKKYDVSVRRDAAFDLRDNVLNEMAAVP